MLRIAVGQMEPVPGDVDANLWTSELFIRSAAEQGADIVVLPELASSGPLPVSLPEALALAEVPGEGEATVIWKALAVELGLVIVAGFPELAGEQVLSSAILCRPDGTHTVTRPGEPAGQVVLAGVGRVGVLIGDDAPPPADAPSSSPTVWLSPRGIIIDCVP